MRLPGAVLLVLVLSASGARGAVAEDEPASERTAARRTILVIDRGADARKGAAFDSDCVEALVDALKPRVSCIPLSRV